VNLCVLFQVLRTWYQIPLFKSPYTTIGQIHCKMMGLCVNNIFFMGSSCLLFHKGSILSMVNSSVNILISVTPIISWIIGNGNQFCKYRYQTTAVSYKTFICCNSFMHCKYLGLFICKDYCCKVVTDYVYLSAAHAIYRGSFCIGSAIPLKQCVRNYFVTS